MKVNDVYVVAAVRTAIGTFGGSLKDTPLTQLATAVVQAALERSRVDPARVGHVVMGNVIPTDPKDAYLARVAAMDSGIPELTPAFNVNRLCGSGLQAIISAAHTLMLGEATVAVGGGAESMSRSPYVMAGARWAAAWETCRLRTTCWASCTTRSIEFTWASPLKTSRSGLL
jgi:acetyl-CoA C-acetyltransferase